MRYKLEEREIDGQIIQVKIYSPSRKKADGSIQKPRFSRTPQAGANFLWREREEY